jgi:hypothetical protein
MQANDPSDHPKERLGQVYSRGLRQRESVLQQLLEQRLQQTLGTDSTDVIEGCALSSEGESHESRADNARWTLPIRWPVEVVARSLAPDPGLSCSIRRSAQPKPQAPAESPVSGAADGGPENCLTSAIVL